MLENRLTDYIKHSTYAYIDYLISGDDVFSGYGDENGSFGETTVLAMHFDLVSRSSWDDLKRLEILNIHSADRNPGVNGCVCVRLFWESSDLEEFFEQRHFFAWDNFKWNGQSREYDIPGVRGKT